MPCQSLQACPDTAEFTPYSLANLTQKMMWFLGFFYTIKKVIESLKKLHLLIFQDPIRCTWNPQSKTHHKMLAASRKILTFWRFQSTVMVFPFFASLSNFPRIDCPCRSAFLVLSLIRKWWIDLPLPTQEMHLTVLLQRVFDISNLPLTLG